MVSIGGNKINLEVLMEIHDAVRDLNKLEEEIKDTAQAAERSGDDAQEGFSKWSIGLMGVQAGLQTAKQAIDGMKQAWDFAKEGAAIETLRGQFDNLAVSIGSTSDAILTDLKAATGGMVSDSELIRSATDLISLGLTDTKDDTVELATLVSQLGWDMQTVIMTFANNSKMRLDALGLSVTDVEDKMKTLEAQGYSTDEAFDMAVIEAGREKLELLGDAADTSIASFAKLETRILNLTDRLKELAAKGIIPVLDNLSNTIGFEEAAAAARELGAVTAAQVREMRDQIYEGTRQMKNEEARAIITERTAEKTAELSAIIARQNEQIEVNSMLHGDWVNVVKDTTEAIEEEAEALTLQDKKAESARWSMQELRGEQEAAANAANLLTDDTKALQASMDAAATAAANFQSQQSGIAMSGYRDAVQAVASAYDAVEEAVGGSWAAQKEANDLLIASNAEVLESYKRVVFEGIFGKQMAAGEFNQDMANTAVALGLMTQAEANRKVEISGQMALLTQAITDYQTELDNMDPTALNEMVELIASGDQNSLSGAFVAARDAVLNDLMPELSSSGDLRLNIKDTQADALEMGEHFEDIGGMKIKPEIALKNIDLVTTQAENLLKLKEKLTRDVWRISVDIQQTGMPLPDIYP